MFEPYFGKSWGAADSAVASGVRLLALGESHYGESKNGLKPGECDPAMTLDTIERYARKGQLRFFTGIVNVVSSKPKASMSGAEISAFWDGMAFYNYVPVIVSNRSRVRPTNAMFEAGRKPFERLLADPEQRPEAVLVCGFALWNWVTYLHRDAFRPDPLAPGTGWIGEVPIARMKHPSSAFSWGDWRPTAEALLEKARSRTGFSSAASHA